MRKVLSMLVVMISISGCGSVPVDMSEQGSKVMIVDYIRPDERGNYQEIDQVKCKLGMNARTRSANIEGCHNELKNKAADLGGSLVLVQNPDGSRYELGTTGRMFVGDCENCVEMKGLVFKKKK